MVCVVAVEFLQLGDGQLRVAKLRVFHQGSVDEHVLLLLGHREKSEGQWLGITDWEAAMRELGK